MYLPQVQILQVVKIYTINMYKFAKVEYMKGQGCAQDHVSFVQNERTTEHVYFIFENDMVRTLGFVLELMP